MKKLFPLSCAFLLSGCLNMSGLDAQHKFECKAPDGVLCESMSGVYANARANNLPQQQVRNNKRHAENASAAQSTQRSHAIRKLPMPNASSSGTPLYQNPKILRIWVAPWEAQDRTLYDQNYMYLVVDEGGWQIEHNRRQIRDAFAAIQPPAQSTATPLSRQQDRVTLPSTNIDSMVKDVLNNTP